MSLLKHHFLDLTRRNANKCAREKEASGTMMVAARRTTCAIYHESRELAPGRA